MISDNGTRYGRNCDTPGTADATCTCGCYGCKFHCGAHWPWWMRLAARLRPWRYWWNTGTSDRGVSLRYWFRTGGLRAWNPTKEAHAQSPQL